ncbi:hypothetical protein EDD16DRAFT_1721145 [Pisolithus croceorrhizus]|nr:hypothetical protein EDD16DRAFT_1721145 [Pisolithus croceorrhizus]KAI6097997.1 hypothetical protein EV401DRAFT_2082326 [Pisolithus croceorrhizus]KAI6167575.1 hypothetical protein EDD17DRAFT_1750905 [Pisolithus thermaeus]
MSTQQSTSQQTVPTPSCNWSQEDLEVHTSNSEGMERAKEAERSQWEVVKECQAEACPQKVEEACLERERKEQEEWERQECEEQEKQECEEHKRQQQEEQERQEALDVEEDAEDMQK